MKVLFVSGGNTDKFGIPPLVKVQGNSLNKAGIEVSYFPIIGKGIIGYLKNIPKLKKYLKENHVNIIHAHYSFSGLLVSLSSNNIPVVVSLLGSDVNTSSIFKKLIIKFIRFYWWNAIIVKSYEMSVKLKKTECHVIPNGVDTNLFQPLDKFSCKKQLNWDLSKTHILFAANPKRPEKNFALTKKAVDLLNDDNIELHHFENVEHRYIPLWLNASDLVILSSLWEGSPNVIKEAMACNRPIVATDVGDIKWLFGNEPGQFLAKNDIADFTKKMKLGLEYSSQFNSTNGRNRIFELNLDSKTVAVKLSEIYQSLV